MIPIRILAVLIFLFSVFFSVETTASDRSNRVYYREQLIINPIQSFEEARWFGEDEPFVDVVLTPSRVFELVSPITIEGTTLVDAGTLMVSMHSRRLILCMEIPPRSAFVSKSPRTCIADLDRDGAFEAAWTVKTRMLPWDFAGLVPKELVSIENPELKDADAGRLHVKPRLRIESHRMAFRRKPRDGSDPYWEAFVSARIESSDGGGEPLCLRRAGRCRGYRDGHALGVGNLMFKVVEIADERIRLRLLSNFKGDDFLNLTPMQPEPFYD